MRKLMIALAMGAAMLPFDGFSLGLGEIEVNSALNQELDAEIKLLSAGPEETETLIVKLASREEFSRAGLDRPYLLQSLKFGSVIKDGVPYITIATNKPIREPFLNFLVEVDWPKGHLLREYTILLDPPVFLNEASAAGRPSVSESRGGPRPASAPANEAGPRPSNEAGPRPSNETGPRPYNETGPRPSVGRIEPTSSAPPTPLSAQPAPRAAAPVATTYASAGRGGGEYRIKQGDTAWSLADAMRPDQSVSIEQMMLALLRTNPESFINGNVNGLKRGYILRVPERSEIDAVSQAEAVAIVRQQHGLWREYRQTATDAGPVATGVAKTGSAKSSSASEKPPGARLSIVSAGKGAATGASGDAENMSAADLRAQLALVEERLESELLEKESLQGDVEALEQQVGKMKRLLSIDDPSLAELQSLATEQPPAAQAKPRPESTEKLLVPDAALEALDTELMPTDDDAAAIMPDETPAEPAEDMDNAKVFVDEAGKDAATDSEMTAELEKLQNQASEPVVEINQDPGDPFALDQELSQTPALVTKLMANPLVPAAVGGGLLLLMALVYMIVKRRRGKGASAKAGSADDFLDDDLASVADLVDDEMDITPAKGAARSKASAPQAAKSFDSDATMIMPAVADKSPGADAGDEPRDDIIAEADVYLAYGIYQQAEELLQNAIKEHSDNDAYRVKLAETYYAGKNVSAFGELAAEMHKRTSGKGSRWQKIAAMGKELIPGHALFKGAAAAGDVALDDLVPEPTMDFDLGMEDSAEKTEKADLDFSLDDDTELDLPDLSLNEPDSLEFEDDTAADTDLSFELEDTKTSEPEAEEEEFLLDIEASELDISMDDGKSEAAGGLDFDLDLSAEAEADSDDEVEFDIDVSADLEDNSYSRSSNADDDAEIDLSDLEDVDEVSTKLDLARAYLDMGDHEGTRSILEEVASEGNAEQKAEAKGLLAEIEA